MNLLRLDPPIYVLTPLGEAEAYFIQVPLSNDRHAVWGVFQKETKEQWWWDNTHVRLVGSISERRDGDCSPFYLSDALKTLLEPHLKRHTKATKPDLEIQ